MSESTSESRNVAEAEFPAGGTTAEKFQVLLKYSVLAPSNRNTQPWLWKVNDEGVELYADRSRALPVVDPHDRELIIGCGASLLHLRIALRHFGYRGEVAILPDRGNPDLLARVTLGGEEAATENENLLFWAIPRRHTNRQPFEQQEVPEALLHVLQDEASSEAAWLHTLEGDTRDMVVELIMKGDWIQGHDEQYRRELAEWIHSNQSERQDGLPGYALGMGDLASRIAPVMMRMRDTGPAQAERDRQLAESAPVLAVLGTDGDNPRDWLAAGQAVARVLLRARAAGVSASFFNQPIQVTYLWAQLCHAIGNKGFPQLLFRLGYAAEAKATPRRAVDEVLIEPS